MCDTGCVTPSPALRAARSRHLLSALVFALAAGCGRTAAPEPSARERAPDILSTETAAAESATLTYLDIPLGGASATDKLPLVIAIHGLGDSPQNFSRWLLALPARVRLIIPQAPTTHGRGFSWFPYRPDRSEHELARGMAVARDQLVALLDQLEAKHPGLRAPAVLGFSQGGMLSFALAARYPERFSLVVPISGMLPRQLDPPSKIPRQLPVVHAFHGEADRVVPIAPGADAVSRLAGHGYPATLQRYPEVGHQIAPSVRDAVFAEVSRWAAPAPD